MDALVSALEAVFSLQVLLTIFLSAAFGLFVGAIPGLTATMATALLVPLTFFMEPVQAIACIVSSTVMTIFAGDIPATLLRIPGTPASAAYVDDAYLLGQGGRAGQSLGVNLLCSCVGGILSVGIVMTFAPSLARLALNFTSNEYFWLALLGLSCAVLVARAHPVKSAVSLLLGLLLSMVGIDAVMGVARLTLGSMDLMAGIAVVPTMVGMFAIAELLRNIPSLRGGQAALTPRKPGPVFKGTGTLLWRYKKSATLGSGIGTLVGVLPGAGADIAAWVAYAASRKLSKTPEKFGTGHPEGIIAAGASNNAALTGSYVPALVFGIPGDTITAIVIGVLLMKGITPGPLVFVNEASMIWSLYIIFAFASVLMIPLGWLAIRGASTVLMVPYGVLYPVILMLCIVGSFAASNSMFDVGIMLAMGILAYILVENDFPIAPLILALILGPIIEENFMKSLIKGDGQWGAFVDRPLALALGIATLLVWSLLLIVLPLVKQWRRV